MSQGTAAFSLLGVAIFESGLDLGTGLGSGLDLDLDLDFIVLDVDLTLDADFRTAPSLTATTSFLAAIAAVWDPVTWEVLFI